MCYLENSAASIGSVSNIISYLKTENPCDKKPSEMQIKVSYLLSHAINNVNPSKKNNLSGLIQEKLDIPLEVALDILDVISMPWCIGLMEELAHERYLIVNGSFVHSKAESYIAKNTEHVISVSMHEGTYPLSSEQPTSFWSGIMAYRQASLDLSYRSVFFKAESYNINRDLLCSEFGVSLDDLCMIDESVIDRVLDKMLSITS